MDTVRGPEQAEVVKRGERLILLGMSRGWRRSTTEEDSRAKAPIGLTVSIRTAPQVEEFIQSLSNDGESQPITFYGREWLELPGEAPLKAYNLTRDVNLKPPYRMDMPGGLLYDVDNGYVNLSFLRLVGISQGAGVRFGVREVFDAKEDLEPLQQKILDGCSLIFNRYLCPVDMSLSISTI